MVSLFRWDGTDWNEHATITSPDAATGQWFGRSVAIEGTTLVVGKPRYNVPGAIRAGAVYIFELDADSQEWEFKQQILASAPEKDAHFGHAVAISGDTIVVGAPHNNSVSVLDPQSPAEVFRRNGAGVFVHEDSLFHSGGWHTWKYGRSIAIDGDLILVGARDSFHGSGSGAAFLFERDGTNWFQKDLLRAHDGQFADRFGEGFNESTSNTHLGNAVAIDGDMAVIGAPNSNYPWTNTGAAYVFRIVDGEGQFLQKLGAPQQVVSSHFGTSVAINGNQILIGRPYFSGGSAFKFVTEDGGESWQFDSDAWAQNSWGDEFGLSVALTNELGVVGARKHESGSQSGAVYAYVQATNGAAGDCPNDEDDCPADLTGNGKVGTLDLLTLLGEWGLCGSQVCPADLNGDGRVTIIDLLELLAAWGDCPG